jgi:tetratricopeptide (TPR) repeat protein
MQASDAHSSGNFWRGLILLILVVLFSGWVIVRSVWRSVDPARMVFRWILTVLIVWVMIKEVAPMVWQGAIQAIVGMHLVALCGIALAIVWRRSLADIVARPFGSLFDGGNQELEPQPFYSIAEARRKRGRYDEAVKLIRAQLEKFPTDFEGQMLIAAIQAENLNDLPGAEVTIQRLCLQPGHSPRNLAYALNSLADWHLKYFQDADAARQDLEKIIALLPDSEMAALAAQRIGHLAGTDFMLQPHDRKRVTVTPGIQDLGLRPAHEHPKPAEVNPEQQAAEYVKHLGQHPLDTEVREKLAVVYADYYQRLDLAADQLEQLISHPNQPAKRVVHWLNLLADLQVKHLADYETVRQTLQRIIDLYPDAAAAQTARNRLDLVKLELKAHQKGQTVRMGVYEQNIGLKRGLPPQF